MHPLVPVLVLAAAPAHAPTAAASAARATAAIAKADSGAAHQGTLALDELSKPEYGLPADVRQGLAYAAGRADPADRPRIVAEVLRALDPKFVSGACGAEFAELGALPLDAALGRCRGKLGAALPSHPPATLRLGSVLLSALLVQRFQAQRADAKVVELARWAAHFDRSDAGAPSLPRP